MKKRSISRARSDGRPSARKKPTLRRPQARSRTSLSSQWLKEFFSEMLAVEQGGVELKELTHDDLRPKLEQFREQTQQHVELCQEMLNAAGGGEGEKSPSAEAAEHKARGLLSTEVPDNLKDINNLENLLLAETKDHWNWELLGSLMDQIEGRDLKKVVSRAVREVRRQENQHLSWNQKMLTRLATETAHREPQTDERSEPEDQEEESAEHDY